MNLENPQKTLPADFEAASLDTLLKLALERGPIAIEFHSPNTDFRYYLVSSPTHKAVPAESLRKGFIHLLRKD